jgi:8-oxo-dGTP pyrophosphatase MutT (NUDIX family)
MSSSTAAPPAVPRHAATVLLLREQAGEAQVLMIRRHDNIAFMGGLWVFPGGSLAGADAHVATGAIARGQGRLACAPLRDLQGEALSQHDCMALAVTACREAFEETGVLLAMHSDGRACTPQLIARLQLERPAITADAQCFATLLERERLTLDTSRLVYWAHWITPSSGPRRFDTRFFAVAVAPDLTATVDAIEAVEHTWMSPAGLIEAARKSTMSIAQPTLYNLEDLAASLGEHRSLHAMLVAEQQRTVVPILPKMYFENGRRVIVMPWDADYATTPGEGAPPGIEYPERLTRLRPRASSERG